MLESWDPNPDTMNRHDDRLSRTGRISRVALLRAQRRHKEALELALDCVRAIQQAYVHGLQLPFASWIKAAGMRPEPCLMS